MNERPFPSTSDHWTRFWNPPEEADNYYDVPIDDRFGLMASSPKTAFFRNDLLAVFRIGNNQSDRAERTASTQASFDESPYLNSLRSVNSQGYQYFYSNRLSRRSSLSYAVRRASTALSSISRSLTTMLTSPFSRQSDSVIETARGYSDELNLTELFKRKQREETLREERGGEGEQQDDEEDEEMGPPIEIMEAPSVSGLHTPPDAGCISFRSEPVSRYQLIMCKDLAYECIGEIGVEGVVQIDDVNKGMSLFQRHFVRDVRRCDELERSLRYMERQIYESRPPIQLMPIDAVHIEVPKASDINQLQTKIKDLENRIRSSIESEERIHKTLMNMVEQKHVIMKVEQYLSEQHMDAEAIQSIEEGVREDGPLTGITGTFSFDQSITSNTLSLLEHQEMEMSGLGGLESSAVSLWFSTGVIPVDKKISFEKCLWRACRRTAFVRITEIEEDFIDPLTNITTRKCVFIVFYRGDSLMKIVNNVCEGYGAAQFDCPKTSRGRQHYLKQLEPAIEDMTLVVRRTREDRHGTLEQCAEFVHEWMKCVHMQKGIYHALNKCALDTNGFLSAECWIPTQSIHKVKGAIDRCASYGGHLPKPVLNEIETKAIPPTYNVTNKFTKVFQDIVNAYGVANYREVNPAPYTVISFPFLFALMFGDSAHAFLLLSASLTLIAMEKTIQKRRIRDEIFTTFFNGRYIMLLMGIFSLYTGFIYNDVFGKAGNIFGSNWKNPYNETQFDKWEQYLVKHKRMPVATLDPKEAHDGSSGPYLFGLDPIWNVADNRLSFINSMKMKVAVIFGIAQMTFGVVLSFNNFRFFGSRIDILTSFIPQLIFLSSIFVYLCGQIIIKWIYFSVYPGEVLGYEYPGSNCAPSLLIGLINMFMMKARREGYTNPDGTTVPNCYLSTWYPGQSTVETLLLLTALLCIPVMLLGKPLSILMKRRKKAEPLPEEVALSDTQSTADNIDDHEENFVDIFVHSGIHTIEFVLGCISHTASYLRLWALSLAHAQLSEVLWHMLLMNGLNAVTHQSSSLSSSVLGALVAFLSFFVFGVLTIAILVVMEGLSAFLHALRLHWVEFQSKFYSGDGVIFQPFSMHQCIENGQHLSDVMDDGED
ncbi:hypothetical protein PFISCL1PPCAC_16301 [Pristionchus fissidentatus]|uniref:V-type proton ATPase subunit a n=1 Tax=Pristionchus fissidentatus TaxID=1538716 RepID=A0AAV5W2Q0_9BILA|nr:hypothetical protein PFISCL1PPCAC_16301 [Pristionchus fissidentatus]